MFADRALHIKMTLGRFIGENGLLFTYRELHRNEVKVGASRTGSLCTVSTKRNKCVGNDDAKEACLGVVCRRRQGNWEGW